MPLLVGVLSLPIEIGMVLTTSPLTRTVSVLVLSSAVAITSSPMVKWVRDVVLAEQPVAEVDAVGVHLDVDGGARLPVMLLGANALRGCSASRTRPRPAGWW